MLCYFCCLRSLVTIYFQSRGCLCAGRLVGRAPAAGRRAAGRHLGDAGVCAVPAAEERSVPLPFVGLSTALWGTPSPQRFPCGTGSAACPGHGWLCRWLGRWRGRMVLPCEGARHIVDAAPPRQDPAPPCSAPGAARRAHRLPSHLTGHRQCSFPGRCRRASVPQPRTASAHAGAACGTQSCACPAGSRAPTARAVPCPDSFAGTGMQVSVTAPGSAAGSHVPRAVPKEDRGEGCSKRLSACCRAAGAAGSCAGTATALSRHEGGLISV